MSITAIVYSSNTGYTAEYARLLSQKTGLYAYTLTEAKKVLAKGCEVIYLSWLMAGSVTDYKSACKHFCVKAVAAVGLCETGTITEDVRNANRIPSDVAVFTLQGGYAPQKLRGLHKLLMKMVTRVLINKISAKADQTESDRTMLRTLTDGGSYVCEENLVSVAAYLQDIAENN